MSKKRTTKVSLSESGAVLEHLPGGRTSPVKGKTDWERVARMPDDEVRRLAESDPDARPLTIRELSQAFRVPVSVDVKAIRKRRNMSQAAFARRYGLSRDALQEWEQGRRQPDRCARILFAVIDREPEAVERALRDSGGDD